MMMEDVERARRGRDILWTFSPGCGYPAGVDALLSSSADEALVESEEVPEPCLPQIRLALVITDHRQTNLLQNRRESPICASNHQ